MKRDLDLVRSILLWMQDHADERGTNNIQIEGYTPAQIAYHAHIMSQAGLVLAVPTTTMDASPSMPTAMPMSITWAGHEFIAAARDETLWKKAQEKVLKPAGGVAISVLTDWLKFEAKQRLGLPG